MAEALIETYNSQIYLSAQDYINVFYTTKFGIPETSYISSPLVTKLLDYMFQDFTGLKYLELDNCVSIQHKALANLSQLRELYLKNASYIGSYAFSGCRSLKYLDLPKCVSLGSEAFLDCDSLEELNIPIWQGYSSYTCGHYIIHDLNSLTQLSLNNVKKYIWIKNCPNLEKINLDSLDVVGNYFYPSAYRGCFENLPKLEVLELPKVKTVSALAFRSLPNLKYLALPECSYIDNEIFAETVSAYSLPENVIFSFPKVSYINFRRNSTLKSLVLPAMSNINNLSLMEETIDCYPYYVELPGISIISDRIFAFYNFERSKMTHDMTLKLPNLEVVNAASISITRTYTNKPNGIIWDSPNMRYLASSFFADFRMLKEINIMNLSVINSDVFYYCTNNEGLTLKNTYNVKEVKAGAFCSARIKGNTLNLPNCEIFDFRQYCSYGHNSYHYSLSIYNEGASNAWISYRLDSIYLPALSELIVDASLEGTSYNYNCHPEQIFPQKEFKLDTCKRIRFLDCSSKYITEWGDKDTSCISLYAPQCSTIEYIRTNSSGTNLMPLPFHHVNAPNLTSLVNIRFINTYDLSIPLEGMSDVNLEFWLGWVSNIKYNKSFGGIISITSSYISRNDGRSFILSNVDLSNYYGKFIFDMSSANISSYLSNTINFLFGENMEQVQMTFCNIYSPDYNSNSTKMHINITTLKSIIDNNTLFRNYYPWGHGSYGLSKRIDKIYAPNASKISYNLSMNGATFYSYGIIFGNLTPNIFSSYSYDYQQFLIWNDWVDSLSLPNLETIDLNIVSCSSVSIMSSVYPSYVDVHLNFMTDEFYAPKLSKLNFNVLDESLASYMPNLVHIGFSMIGKLGTATCKSLTLGIHNLEDLCVLQRYEYDSTVLSYYGASLPQVKYLSLSNLKYIPGMSRTYLQVMTETLMLPECEELNINNVEYISQCGLGVYKLKMLELPNLRYLGKSAINGPSLSFISLPKLEWCDDYAFYSKNDLSMIILPSTCSRIGNYFWGSKLTLLELQYPGVVDLGSQQLWYHSMIVRVPMAYLQSYKDHSIWNYSSYIQIIGY